MFRVASKMKLYPGMEQEYQRRHAALWPEMKEAISAHGGRNYSIHWDAETNTLFAYLEVEDKALWDKIGDTEACKKWWDYMADIMETNPDNSPVSTPLTEVFYLA